MQLVRLLLVFAAFGLSVGVMPAQAQSDSPTPVDSVAIADAYGDLSLFILNVAAGLDGVPKDPQAEQLFHDAFAEQLASALPDLDLSDQQALAELPG